MVKENLIGVTLQSLSYLTLVYGGAYAIPWVIWTPLTSDTTGVTRFGVTYVSACSLKFARGLK